MPRSAVNKTGCHVIPPPSDLVHAHDVDLKELMTMRPRHATLVSIVRAALTAAGILAAFAAPRPASAQGWSAFAGGSSHQAISPVASNSPQAILWSTTVDLNPPF